MLARALGRAGGRVPKEEAEAPGALIQLEEQRCKYKEENCQTSTKLKIEIRRADAAED